MLQPFKEELREFREQVNFFDVNFPNDGHSEEEVFYRFEGFGESLWGIEFRLAWLQKTYGLDAQKKFLSELQSEDVHGLTNALALFWSQRNEPVVQYSSFLARVDAFIAELDAPQEYEDYIRFFLTRQLPDDFDRISGVLRIGEVASPIDAYEILVEVITHCIVSTKIGIDHEGWLAQTLDLLIHTNDPRLVSCLEHLSRHGVSIGHMDLKSTLSMPEDVRDDLKKLAVRHDTAQQATSRLLKASINFSALPHGRAIFELSNGFIASASETRYRSQRAEILGCLRCNDEWLTLLAEPRAGSPQELLLKTKTMIEAMSLPSDWWEALRNVAIAVSQFPSAEGEFDVQRILLNRSWPELRKQAQHPELCVGLAISYRSSTNRSQATLANLQFSSLELLKAYGVGLYSELLSSNLDQKLLVFLGRNVFVEEVMERNPLLTTSRSLSEERIRVLQSLARLDEKNASRYTAEIKEITYSIEVKEGAQFFDRSRIYVDVDGLKKWAVAAIAEDFERFKALQASANSESGAVENAIEELRRYIADPEASPPRQILEFGLTEADKLFDQMVIKLRQEFLHNPTNGLDVFLSVRVRHGSFSGNLKAPLEEAGLNPTHIEPLEQNTQARAIWMQLDALGVDISGAIRVVLADAWHAIGSEVQEFARRRVQIKGGVSPDGMIDCPLTRFDINLLKLQTTQDVGIDEFVDRCVQLFYVSVSYGLTALRKTLLGEFKENINALLNGFNDEAHRILSDLDAPVLFDAVARSKTAVAYAIERVASWFMAPESQMTGKTYSFEQIVEISLQVTKNARVGFDPYLNLDIDKDLPPFSIGSGAFVVADALFIMFDNVFLHSGIAGRLGISLRVGPLENGAILIRMENDVADSVERASSNKLADIRTLIESGEASARSRREGGSGLLKLSAIGAKSEVHHGRSNLRFGFDGQKFFVEFVLPVRTLETANHENPDR